MSVKSKLAAAAAASAFASSLVLAGAGAASAEEPAVKPVLNSPSSVSVSGKGADTKVTYTNRSDHDLMCQAFAGPDQLISDFYGYAKKSGNTGEAPAELSLRMMTALTTGQLGFYIGGVEEGKAVTLPSAFDQPELNLPPGALAFTDGSFAPAVLAICANPEGGTYVELEVSAGIGVPAGLGSLDMALTGIGSSGSVANTAGSLGS